MIRNTLFGLSVLALSAGSAFAAPVKHTVAAKPHVVAQADTAAPSGDAAKPAKEAKKSSKKSSKKTTKSDTKPEGAKEMNSAAPATK